MSQALCLSLCFLDLIFLVGDLLAKLGNAVSHGLSLGCKFLFSRHQVLDLRLQIVKVVINGLELLLLVLALLCEISVHLIVGALQLLLVQVLRLHQLEPGHEQFADDKLAVTNFADFTSLLLFPSLRNAEGHVGHLGVLEEGSQLDQTGLAVGVGAELTKVHSFVTPVVCKTQIARVAIGQLQARCIRTHSEEDLVALLVLVHHAV